jgi:hypothetical protein
MYKDGPLWYVGQAQRGNPHALQACWGKSRSSVNRTQFCLCEKGKVVERCADLQAYMDEVEYAGHRGISCRDLKVLSWSVCNFCLSLLHSFCDYSPSSNVLRGSTAFHWSPTTQQTSMKTVCQLPVMDVSRSGITTTTNLTTINVRLSMLKAQPFCFDLTCKIKQALLQDSLLYNW